MRASSLPRRLATGSTIALALLLPPSLKAQTQRPPVDRVPVALPPVTVASRVGADGGRAVQILDRQLLDRLPGTSVQAALAWALGGDLQSRSPAQADFSLRGASYEQTLILVDGQRMRDLQTGHFALDLAVPWEAIERIEIVRGAAAAQYGADAVGGVVNIVTRSSGQALRLRGGSFGLADGGASVTRALGPLQAAIHADYLRTDGHRPGTDATLSQLRASSRYANGRHRLRTDLGWGARDFGAAQFYAPYQSFERTRTLTAGTQWEAAASARLATSVRAGLRHHTDDFVLVRTDPARYRNQHRSLQGELEATARVMPRDGVLLAVGGEAMVAQLRSARLGDRSQQRGALFTEVRVVVGRAEAHLGGRVDGSSDFGAQWIPSAGAVARWTPSLTTRALYAGGWRQPTWTDRYYVDPANRGTPTLQPEQFTNAEVGTHWVPASGATVDLAAFTRRGTQTIDWVRPIGPAPRPAWVATNVGTVTTHGVELLAATPQVMGIRWTARGSLLRLQSVRTAGLEGKYALRPLTQSAGLTAQIGEGGPLWLLVDLGHAKRVGETPYTTVGGRIGRRWGQTMVSLELTNLGRAQALDASGVPIAGPAAALGVTWHGR